MLRLLLRTPKTALLATSSGTAYYKPIDDLAPLLFHGEMAFQGESWSTAFTTLGKQPKDMAQTIHDINTSDKLNHELESYINNVWDHYTYLPES